jgi:hypothetical protein
MWELIDFDFNAESRKKKIDKKASYFLFTTKNLICFANYKKPIKKEEIDEKASEEASHPS